MVLVGGKVAFNLEEVMRAAAYGIAGLLGTGFARDLGEPRVGDAIWPLLYTLLPEVEERAKEGLDYCKVEVECLEHPGPHSLYPRSVNFLILHDPVFGHRVLAYFSEGYKDPGATWRFELGEVVYHRLPSDPLRRQEVIGQWWTLDHWRG